MRNGGIGGKVLGVLFKMLLLLLTNTTSRLLLRFAIISFSMAHGTWSVVIKKRLQRSRYANDRSLNRKHVNKDRSRRQSRKRSPA